MLQIAELDVRYGPIRALRGVSIEVGKGEFVGIVGPNGAGKSTLLLSVVGMVRPQSGRIRGERRHGQAGKLSGGEQQQLAIARAMLGDPKLLLLDEPSLGLAPLITRQVYQVLKRLNETGVTILVVEQNPKRIMKAATRLYVLRNGQIAFSGPPEALERAEDLDRAYFGYHEKVQPLP